MSKVEKEKWAEVKKLMRIPKVELGKRLSYDLKYTPRQFLFTLARYKFAAKLLKGSVLEIGCGEGFGTVLLSEVSKRVVAIDIDREAIRQAKKNFKGIEFACKDFLNSGIYECFDTCISIDVIEHIYPAHEQEFFNRIICYLNPRGVCIIGTPNKEAQKYATEGSQVGHVNLYDWQRLKKIMDKYFDNVFLFSMNDEVVHTGFYPMAHYLMAVGIK